MWKWKYKNANSKERERQNPRDRNAMQSVNGQDPSQSTTECVTDTTDGRIDGRMNDRWATLSVFLSFFLSLSFLARPFLLFATPSIFFLLTTSKAQQAEIVWLANDCSFPNRGGTNAVSASATVTADYFCCLLIGGTHSEKKRNKTTEREKEKLRSFTCPCWERPPTVSVKGCQASSTIPSWARDSSTLTSLQTYISSDIGGKKKRPYAIKLGLPWQKIAHASGKNLRILY